MEWISLLYLLFFVLCVISPALITRGYWELSETILEEMAIFAFGISGLLTFSLYERLLERRERERERTQIDYEKAKRELIESYTYIGTMNRKLELLKTLANESSKSLSEHKQLKKELFHALVANACSTVGANAGIVRIVELSKLRTEREFAHEPDAKIAFHVANRELRDLHEQGSSHRVLLTDEKRHVLVVPSDRSQGDLKAYLLLRMDESETIPEIDTSLLKVFVNQAEMLYRHFVETSL